MRKIIALSTAIAASLVSIHCLAADPASVRISVADINLSEPQGAGVALTRIHRAAATVCAAASWNTGSDSASIELDDACRRQTARNAINALNAPLVSRLAAGSTKTRHPRTVVATIPAH